MRGQHRWGQLCVWESGQIELEITDIETMEMAHSRSEVVESVERLDELFLELLREVEGTAIPPG